MFRCAGATMPNVVIKPDLNMSFTLKIRGKIHTFITLKTISFTRQPLNEMQVADGQHIEIKVGYLSGVEQSC